MTWRHRGIPYGRSTGNFLRVDTVSHKPANPIPETANTRAVGIIDNEDQSTGTGIGLYSRNALILATVDNASWEENCGLEIVTIDAGGAADIILSSGRLPQGDNGDITISSCRAALKPRGDISILGGNIGVAEPSGDLNLTFDDSAHAAGNLLARFGVQSRISATQHILETHSGVATLTINDGANDVITLSALAVTIDGDDTIPSYFDGYAGGLTLQATGGILTLLDLATTPGPIAPPANFSGTMTIAGVEVPYY